MSIKVNIRTLTAWHADLPDQIRVEKLNEIAQDYANEIVNELGRLQCKSHPEEDSYITIIADRINYIIVERKFCCPEFEEKVVLKISR